jgi:hypothetical protein
MIVIPDLKSDDFTRKELLAVMTYGFNVCVEAGMITLKTEEALRVFMRTERVALNVEPVKSREIDHGVLKTSKYYEFWSTLQPGQEVRWRRAKTRTYFVVNGELLTSVRDRPYRMAGPGPYVELRRHSGKTFYTHIALVRPLS